MDGFASSTMDKLKGTYGFIHQDDGGPPMFIMPAAFDAFGRQLPPIGTRLQYTIVTDEKTGRPRAEGATPL